jgi:hypothetical protein
MVTVPFTILYSCFLQLHPSFVEELDTSYDLLQTLDLDIDQKSVSERVLCTPSL